MKISLFKKYSLKIVSFFVFFLLLFTANIFGARAVGVNFLTDPSYDTVNRDNINASIVKEGENAYYYVEDAYFQSLLPEAQTKLLDNISSISSEFDKVIYPNMHQFYGSEWIPGIDGSHKIYILFSDIVKDVGGYYNPNDEYRKEQIKDGRSNEKEVIFLNANLVDNANLKSFLAHEFQHMINWNQKKRINNIEEDVWLNEALSEYSSTLLNYDSAYYGTTLEMRVRNFLQNPSNSMTEWRNSNQDYATVNLFMQYLVDHYGKEILNSIVTTPKVGMLAVNEAIQKVDSKASYKSAFTDWTISNYLNNSTILSGKYGYYNPNLNYTNLHIAPTNSHLVYSNIAIKNEEYTKDWSAKLYNFFSSPNLSTPGQTLKIDFKAKDSDSDFLLSYIIKKVSGAVEVKDLALDTGKSGTISIENFGTDVKSVVIVPISEKKLSGFEETEPLVKFSYEASLIEQNTPSISNIAPAISSIEGGALVTINGENFYPTSSIKFGDTIATEVTYVDPAKIIARAPLSPRSGKVSIEVVNPNRSSAVLPQAFLYLPEIPEGSLIRATGD